jgi:molybdate transport system substrate-binding protein
MRTPTRRRFAAGLLAALPAGASAAASGPPAAEALIAAAANMKFALDILAAQFRAETGQGLRIAYGASGNLTQQLLHGAPFELFLSADEGSVFQLADAGRTLDRGTLYAEGRAVLFAAHASPVQVDERFDGLRAALAAGHIRRFAIASPEHAPYGRAAEQALRSQGLWEAIRPRLVLGESVAQAAQFAGSPAVQGGIIPLSLALAPEVARLGRHAVISQSWHAPLLQRMVLMRHAGPVARAFHTWLQQPRARAVLRRHGFAVPGAVA